MSEGAQHALDLICIGRTSVDLYAEQEGARLEDVQSFRKYVGGSATNIAVGTARLGVKAAMLTRVGNEHMGRFVCRTLAENGVDVSQVRFDPEHLTPYVLLTVRAIEDFPRIFAYGDAADLAVEEDDVEPDFIASSKALLVTGTPFSRSGPRAASFKAIQAAKEAGTRVVFDLDYRPVFWGVATHEQGGEMFVASEKVTEIYRSALPGCDLVVGTEEEIRIAGGSTDTIEALRSIRGLSGGTIVLKVGAMGAIVFPGEIPDAVEDGVSVPGFPVEVFNSVGAGDAFMSGFLSGWLREEPLEECLRLGNACGAIVVSRHGCSPAMPTSEELEYYLPRAGGLRRLQDDEWLNHLHRATTRNDPGELRVLAIDHRWQLEEVADELGVDRENLRELKLLLGRAFRRVAEADEAAGVLLDGVYGDRALEELTGSGAWIARRRGGRVSARGVRRGTERRRHAKELAPGARGQVQPVLAPARRPGDQGPPGTEGPPALRCLRQERPAVAVGGPGPTGHALRRELHGAAARPVLRDRRAPRVVEAAAEPGSRRVEGDRVCCPRARPVLRGSAGTRAGVARGGARRELRRGGLRASVQRVRDRALHIR
jgi:5-dehydro-2-deoxygluconokinase